VGRSSGLSAHGLRVVHHLRLRTQRAHRGSQALASVAAPEPAVEGNRTESDQGFEPAMTLCFPSPDAINPP
jgi:hypothetical protein